MDLEKLIKDGDELNRSVALRKCFDGDSFNCCPLADIGEYMSREAKAIRVYHCISFSDMPHDTLKGLESAVIEFMADAAKPKPKPKTFLSWFLS